MSTFQAGQIVTVTGHIERIVGSQDVPPDKIAIGKPSNRGNYAMWLKLKWGWAWQAMVLGYTYKLAGELESPSTGHGWNGYEVTEQYTPGGITIDCTGKAWVVMPLAEQPNKYRIPITTIEEFMQVPA